MRRIKVERDGFRHTQQLMLLQAQVANARVELRKLESIVSEASHPDIAAALTDVIQNRRHELRRLESSLNR